jgi:hypothetical protein
MSTLAEHLGHLRRIFDAKGWLSDAFHYQSAIMCGAHLKELEALVAKADESRKALELIRDRAKDPASDDDPIMAFSAIHSIAFCALKDSVDEVA